MTLEIWKIIIQLGAEWNQRIPRSIFRRLEWYKNRWRIQKIRPLCLSLAQSSRFETRIWHMKWLYSLHVLRNFYSYIKNGNQGALVWYIGRTVWTVPLGNVVRGRSALRVVSARGHRRKTVRCSQDNFKFPWKCIDLSVVTYHISPRHNMIREIGYWHDKI